jgi:4a-hydroxytetrahydrobiopterin dehydratase
MNKITENLIRQKCKPCEGGVDPIPDTQVKLMLNGLDGWELVGGKIQKLFTFKDHHQTFAFAMLLHGFHIERITTQISL